MILFRITVAMNRAGRIRTISETLTVYRGKTDKYGNPNGRDTPYGTIQGLIGWGSSRGPNFQNTQNAVADAHGESFSISATLFVRKGTDVKVRDRLVRANGQAFVVGPVMWDEPEPFGGDTFLDEDVVYQLTSTNG
ncbi:Uncharacterised protein [Mycobacteroides abscessus subsp. bolletii]|nr:Uncharacterised protein [Mycobacteroides abscessus subsp. abscessus]SKT45277.1 Uncharacterised protein [Mycobacteroides abscessus subsp. bolletii]